MFNVASHLDNTKQHLFVFLSIIKDFPVFFIVKRKKVVSVVRLCKQHSSVLNESEFFLTVGKSVPSCVQNIIGNQS